MLHLVRLSRLTLAAIAAIAAMTPAPAADDPCAGFSWNVAHERALFAGAARTLAAGRGAAAAPSLEVERLYDLTLAPHAQVQLPVVDRAHGAGTGFSGLVRVQIPAAGSYRMSVGSQMWVDLVSGSMLLATSDFAGQHGCDAPHKIVQFDLQPGTFILQMSGAASDHVRVTVTRSPRS